MARKIYKNKKDKKPQKEFQPINSKHSFKKSLYLLFIYVPSLFVYLICENAQGEFHWTDYLFFIALIYTVIWVFSRIFIRFRFEKTYFTFSVLGGLIRRTYQNKEIDGFYVDTHIAAGFVYQYIYLYSKNKRVATLSDFEYRNFKALEECVSRKYNYLGCRKRNFLQILKEGFIDFY